MITENPFKGREFENLVFPSNHHRCHYVRFNAWQKENWRKDHPDLWKTREDALRDLQARAGLDVKAESAEPYSATPKNEARHSGESEGPLLMLGEDKRLTAAAGDEIIVGERRFISERGVAAMLGYSHRQLQRWRKEQKGPPSTKIGRRCFYEISKLHEWIEREKSR